MSKVLPGYRTVRPEGQDLSQALARVMDTTSRLCKPQLTLLMRFVEFLADMDVQQVKEDRSKATDGGKPFWALAEIVLCP